MAQEQSDDAWGGFWVLAALARDLATGDWRVLGWMLAKRTVIDLTGSDLAPSLPPSP